MTKKTKIKTPKEVAEEYFSDPEQQRVFHNMLCCIFEHFCFYQDHEDPDWDTVKKTVNLMSEIKEVFINEPQGDKDEA